MTNPKKTLGKLAPTAFGMLELPRLPKATLDGFRVLAKLGGLTGLICDAMDQLGIVGGIPGSVLRPTDPGARVIGQALTLLNLKIDASVPELVAGKVSQLADIEAHNLAEPGDVLVVQGVPGVSSMGGIMASVARRAGEAGAIVDGAVRDIDHSRAVGYPVWCSSVSPLTGKWRVRTVGVNVPVMIAGVRVQPGDLVIADEVGVCFVPRERAAEVLATAQSITVSEEKRLAALATGISIAEFFSLSTKK
jgi:regulator of RNase E activity RraA